MLRNRQIDADAEKFKRWKLGQVEVAEWRFDLMRVLHMVQKLCKEILLPLDEPVSRVKRIRRVLHHVGRKKQTSE